MSKVHIRKSGKISSDSFIVGIGSSAGGLEALQSFVKGLTADIVDTTYIVAQHLSPQYKSMLVELLGKTDNIEVVVAEDGITPEIGKMYITPPNADVVIKDLKIHLTLPQEGAGPKPSVDKFFRSIALNAGTQAIGVILSGTGSDGAEGIRAIRSEGGITVVQEPETAKYDGMPEAAINTDCVDSVLAPNEVGDYIAKIVKTGKKRPEILSKGKNEFEDILRHVDDKTGLSFLGYKESTLQRRLERRMIANGIVSLDSYYRYLCENEDEPAKLVQDFLISVTEFFRDKQAFAGVKELLLDKLKDQSKVKALRIWSVGCATGEEAYSLAMLCAEALGGPQNLHRHRIQIIATDIDSNALAVAREGSYSLSAMQTVPEELRAKYFIANGDRYTATKPLKDIILFSKHNILENPPFSRIDMITCRNVLIYFANELQEKAFKIFHYSLLKDGVMFLGKSESTGKSDVLFKKLSKQGNFYSKKPASLSTPLGLKFHSADDRQRSLEVKRNGEGNAQSQLLSSILASLAPQSVLVNENLDILHVYGDISSYLKMPSGKPTLNLGSHIIDTFKQDVRVFTFKVVREGIRAKSTTKPVAIQGEVKDISLSFYPVEADGQEPMILVTFESEVIENSLPQPSKKGNYTSSEIYMLEQELQATQEHLQTVIEELETLNEELQSTNEELQSSNEELHSTNEELETSNEELQSTNEELTTVNDELSLKKQELELSNEELVNFLHSVSFPMIRVDEDLQVVRCNQAAQTLFDLPEDTQLSLLRSIPDSIDITQIVKNTNDVLNGVKRQELRLVFDDRAYWMRFYPYYSARNEVVGVTLTLIDETDSIRQRAKLEDSQARYKALADNSILPIYIKDLGGKYLAANKALQELFGYSEEELLGRSNLELIKSQPANNYRKNDIEVQVSKKTQLFEEVFKTESGERTYLSIKSPLFDNEGQVYATSGINVDITEQKEYARQLEMKNDEVLRANQVKSDFLANMSHEMRTPLNAICGIADILETFNVDEQKRTNLTRKLNVGARQLYNLINEILDFSAIENHEFKLVEAPFDLYAMCTDLHDINSIKAEQKNLNLIIPLEPDTCRYYIGDKTRIKQVLLNVIDNAIKFTDSGSVEVAILSRSDNLQEREELQFVIKDSGIGISDKQIANIFNKFDQGDVSLNRKAKGTGLGLSITKALIDRMGGNITLHSELNQGTIFTLTFPLKAASEQEIASMAEPFSTITSHSPKAHKILVVEDTEANLDVICTFLDYSGLKWDVARNGVQALEKIEQQPYSLVLLDLQMEVMDGFEVATRIRANDNPEINSTPIIAVTGHAESSIRKRCFKLGMQEFLVKPLSLKKLSEVLQAHIGVSVTPKEKPTR